jgi:DNA-binding NarL/FixJ family response regulator
MGFAPYDAPLPTTHAQVQALRRCLAGRSTTSGVLIAEVSAAAQLREAAAVVSGIGIDWLVLAGVRPGPAWWALEDAGARLVLPLTSSLDQLVSALRDHADRRPEASRPAPGAGRDVASARRHQLLRQVGQLTNREMQILVALRGGSTVIEIAAGFGVAESTVRTQVKSTLRKLGVRTQLQAVAILRQADEWLTGAG